MTNIECVVYKPFQELQPTNDSPSKARCFVTRSSRRQRVKSIPSRISTKLVKCVLSPTLDQSALAIEKPSSLVNNIESLVDFHGKNLSKKPRDYQNEILPKVIEPVSLAELLQNPFARGESFRATICNLADSLVTSFLMPSEHKPSVDPHVQLSGLFAPVSETPPTECPKIRGRLPNDLNGVYLRNGSNPSLMHRGEGYHVFDGDGMIQSIMIRNGSASFCSRFVQTSRFRQEQASGRPLFPKFFSGLFGMSGAARALVTILRIALGLIDVTQGWGVSNTSVAFFNGHVLSLSEEDMPYIIRIGEDGDIVTSRRYELPFQSNMCSHPKIDPISGDMFAFSLNVPFSPHYSIFRVPAADGVNSADDAGVPLLDVPVPLFDIPMVHDFAITQRFIIFPDNQIVIRPGDLTKGEVPLGCDTEKTTRFCLLPKNALPEESAPKPQWFEAPGLNCLHYLNAWEEGADEVVLIASEVSPVERIQEIPLAVSFGVSEIRFNTRSGSVKRRAICSGVELELGVINQNYIGRKTRYAYCALGAFPNFNGVVKLDLTAEGSTQESIVARREFGEGKFGGEPFFVPVRGATSEDHGYLLCLVGDEKGGVSELLVMDALSPSLEVIAAIELPARVPPGFHGCFVNEQQLAQQKL